MVTAANAPVELTEAEAIEGAQQGNETCFEFLYRKHKRRVYSICLRMVNKTPEAEDLTQDTFLQLHRKITSFRGEAAFTTWLHRMTVNVVLMYVRKKGLPTVPLDEMLESDEGGEDYYRQFGTADCRLAGSVDRVVIDRAIEQLASGYRIAFVLHDIEGLEHNEIAEMMGCSIGNSKSQLHKARMKLRSILSTNAAGRSKKNKNSLRKATNKQP